MSEINDKGIDLVEQTPIKFNKYLLEKWIVENNIISFEIEDFFDTYPLQRKHRRKVENIISALCKKNWIVQNPSKQHPCRLTITNLFLKETKKT